MKVEFEVTAYVITISDDTEIEVFLQNKLKENQYDYDLKLDARGKKAIKIENNIEVGDKIVIEMPNSWDPGWEEGVDNEK